MGLWSGERLVNSQHTVEPCIGYPLSLINKFLPDHPDLSYRATPCQKSKAQKPKEKAQIRLLRCGGCILIIPQMAPLSIFALDVSARNSKHKEHHKQ
jgi:hypothetical protein